ncbi:cbb3-type cytochrome c oxidase subunit 3 [Methylocystis sp. WRRC1]|uniref:cbb3-type cytochrome c oxidase subunit 3 n=1 Tax=unclassified Methylocystis TaxID=2625913 RepID=UPI0001F86F24|nr:MULTISPECIES: cbb3-type cytochrome c oxidase subunit 3 [unclassified Methylocystis]MCC3246836.1 cbb3-type cytochrome c oxidase subunit 3 [Methylocystis sp. WRRC1]
MNGAAAEVVSTYEAWRAFAASWGLIFFGVIFLGVIAYVFWPSRKKSFDEAAEMPLREDDDDVSGR